jgi:hypothetical protein
MEEAQHKARKKAKQKPSIETSNKVFAVELEVSNILDTLNNLNKIPEIQ